MGNVTKPPLLGTLRIVVAAVLVAMLAGCYNSSPNQTTYAVANGVNATVGGVEVRSLLIVSTGKAKPGRLLGTLFNQSQAPVEVTFSDGDDQVKVTVPKGAEHRFDETPAIFPNVSDIPGSRVAVTVTAGTESTKLSVPVLDGTLEPYRPYVPTTTAAP